MGEPPRTRRADPRRASPVCVCPNFRRWIACRRGRPRSEQRHLGVGFRTPEAHAADIRSHAGRSCLSGRQTAAASSSRRAETGDLRISSGKARTEPVRLSRWQRARINRSRRPSRPTVNASYSRRRQAAIVTSGCSRWVRHPPPSRSFTPALKSKTGTFRRTADGSHINRTTHRARLRSGCDRFRTWRAAFGRCRPALAHDRCGRTMDGSCSISMVITY